MKRIFRTVALIATIGLTAAGCQKEQVIPVQQEITENASDHLMYYCVDGESYSESISDQTAMNAFWQRIFALVREGYEVDVYDASRSGQEASTKEVITFTTRSEEEALAWSEAMTKQGYMVHISFKDGTYTCTAVK